MLTQEQTWEYNRFQRLNTFLSANQSIYQGFQPFADEVADFENNFSNLETVVPNKNIIATGITTDKSELKKSISDTLGLICTKTFSFALKTGNDELSAQMNTRPDKILRMRDADLLAYTTTITSLITPLLADATFTPYGIDATQLGDVLKDATTFNNMIGKADATTSGNTVANTSINKAIALLRLNVQQFDLLVDEFEIKNPEFVQGYHINSSVDKTGVRHNGVEGNVTDKSAKPIINANVQLVDTTKSASTNLLGFYHLNRTMARDFMITCTAEGYTSQTRNIHISRGKTEELNWQLEMKGGN